MSITRNGTLHAKKTVSPSPNTMPGNNYPVKQNTSVKRKTMRSNVSSNLKAPKW